MPISKVLTIQVNVASGKIISAEDENKCPGTPLTQAELDQTYSTEPGFKYVGLLLFSHSSPGCVTFNMGGSTVKWCS